MKKIGIIGGVGPSATADLYRLITKNTPATTDQEHLRIIIDSYPQIPDRTKALLYEGESPQKYLLESIQILEQSGVEYVACPCNTAHVFLRELENNISIGFIDMIKETLKYLKEKGITKAGLLSTEGTAKTEIYQKTAKEFGIEIFIPSEKGIQKEMEAIYGKEGIKAGMQFEKSKKNKSLLLEASENFFNQGASALIMGCTEIPLCLEAKDVDLLLINPTEILAQSIVRYALF